MLEMSQRIRQLEDGVQILSAATSANPHPLLGDEYLSIKSCNYDGVEEEKEEEDPEQPIELTDAFGTLAITDKGEVRFMGRVSSEVRYSRYPESHLCSRYHMYRLCSW